MPHREAVVLGLVVGPFEDRAAPGLELNSQVLAVPLRELLVIVADLKNTPPIPVTFAINPPLIELQFQDQSPYARMPASRRWR
jgi:hypothetical protein